MKKFLLIGIVSVLLISTGCQSVKSYRDNFTGEMTYKTRSVSVKNVRWYRKISEIELYLYSSGSDIVMRGAYSSNEGYSIGSGIAPLFNADDRGYEGMYISAPITNSYVSSNVTNDYYTGNASVKTSINTTTTVLFELAITNSDMLSINAVRVALDGRYDDFKLSKYDRQKLLDFYNAIELEMK